MQQYPIRTLLPTEFPVYAEHLKRLSKEDRRLRFGTPVTNDFIDQYVAKINPTESIILGHFDSYLNLVAAIQVACISSHEAEIGLLVSNSYI
jgi:hypothetical protein